WSENLRANGVSVRMHRASARTQMMRALVRIFGPDFVLKTVAGAEYADRDKYAGQPDGTGMSEEEHRHASIVQEVANRGTPGQSRGSQIASAESWHRGVSSGNDLAAAVLGANDGLVSNFCLIMGVAGAGAPSHTILLTGFAGLVAGACSMALGEWLSVTNPRELARTKSAKKATKSDIPPQRDG